MPLLEKVLPRHMLIIFNINHEFLREMKQYSFLDDEKLRRMSIIEEGYEKQVRMAHLCIVGSHSVNGVSKLHSDLLVNSLVPEFAQIWPEKFNNKTNGVAPRRWLMKANEGLTDLISRTLDENKWITDLRKLRDLEPFAEDAEFREAFKEVKRQNKLKLAGAIQDLTGVAVDPDSMFDVQIKRIHEYKRQLLNVMGIIHDYLGIVERGEMPQVPRTYIFAGKAAPGYWAAKQIIKLIHSVADVVNNDEKAKDLIKIAFLPDYRVSLAQLIIPAADLSEQISMAGMEASGTGNMKLSMNGALTIGTYDGANIEIAEEVGEDNIYIFGLRAEEIHEMQQKGSYNPRERYDSDAVGARGDGRAGLRPLLPQRAWPVPLDLRRTGASRRPLLPYRRLPGYVETQQLIEGEYLNRGNLVAQGDSQCRPHRQVLQRSHHSGVLARYLAYRSVREQSPGGESSGAHCGCGGQGQWGSASGRRSCSRSREQAGCGLAVYPLDDGEIRSGLRGCCEPGKADPSPAEAGSG